MRPSSRLSAALLFSLAACGDGSKTADVVQAATRGAAEVGQQLAEKAAQLAQMTPEEAKAKLHEFVDAASRELKEIRDSETAQKVAAELQRLLDELAALAKKLGEKLDLAGLHQSVGELIERFKNDPHVANTLKSLKEKLDSIGS
jgi:hypothetical protein